MQEAGAQGVEKRTEPHEGRLLPEGGLRYNERGPPGAQTERRSGAGPVRGLLGGKTSPAALSLSQIPLRVPVPCALIAPLPRLETDNKVILSRQRSQPGRPRHERRPVTSWALVPAFRSVLRPPGGRSESASNLTTPLPGRPVRDS